MNSVAALFSKKLKSKNLIWAACFFCIVWTIFTIWVHYSFQGNYWGPFLPGYQFGIPVREQAMGMYPTSSIGWDAQFYYYQSNDLFAQRDGHLHIDNPPYRYQRIGMPLIAATIATVLGYALTPPWLYHFLQILMVSIGFYFLLYWLEKQKISRWYALAWPFSVGVLNALLYGMPDPVGDAFFIISLVALLERRVWLYLVSTTLLLLVREGYAVYGLLVAAFTIFQKIEWKVFTYRWKSMVATTFPIFILFVWMLFVSLRFGKSAVAAGANANLTDYPFIAFIKTFLANSQNNLGFEDALKILGLLVLLLGLYLVIKASWKNFEWRAVAGYFVLMSCLGTTVWFDYSGYMKAFGSIILVIIMLLYQYKEKKVFSSLIQIFLLLTLVVGVGYNFTAKRNAFYSQYKVPTFAQAHEPQNTQLTDFSSHLEADNFSTHIKGYSGLLSTFHRSTFSLPVVVENRSSKPWYTSPQEGLYAINMSYHWYDETGVTLVYDGIRTPIPQNLLPNEPVKTSMTVMVPPPGKYTLKLSMMQEGVSWFYLADAKNGSTYHVTVE